MFKLVKVNESKTFEKWENELGYTLSKRYYDDNIYGLYCSSTEGLPSIYFEEDINGFKPVDAKIETTSYGAVSIERIDEIIKGLEIAKETVKQIKEQFLNK